MTEVGRTPGTAPDLTRVPMGTVFTVPPTPNRPLSALEIEIGATTPGFWVRWTSDQEFTHTVPWIGANAALPTDVEMHKFVLKCVIGPQGEGEHLLARGQIASDAPFSRWAGPHRASTDSTGFVYYLFLSRPSRTVSTFRLRWHGEVTGECPLPPAWSRPLLYPAFCAVRQPVEHLLAGQVQGFSTVRGTFRTFVKNPDSPQPQPPAGGGGLPNTPGATQPVDELTAARPHLPRGGNGNVRDGETTSYPLSEEPGKTARVSGLGFGAHQTDSPVVEPEDDLTASRPHLPRGGNGNVQDGETTSYPLSTTPGRSARVSDLGFGAHQTDSPVEEPEAPKFGRWEFFTVHSPGESVEDPPEVVQPEPECRIQVGFTVHANAKVRTYYKTLQVYPASDNAARGRALAQAWPSFETIWRDDAIYEGR